MNLRETLFTTGEFSKLCGVKKQTLFHYDQIDILKPEYRNEKGYRYYSLKQLEIFSVIDILKDLELSLSQIKIFLDIRSIPKTINLLNSKEKEIDLKIEQMERQKLFIQNKRDYLQLSYEADYSSIEIVELTERYYLISENIGNITVKSSSHKLMAFIDYIKTNNLDSGYPIGVIIKKNNIQNDRYNEFSNFYIQVDKDVCETPLIRDKALYVIAYHEGPDETLYKTHKKIKNYMQIEGFKIIGDSFEEYAVDEISTNGPDKYVTKISIQVEKD
ncbi:MerR family transcriptional regulator (plasmid) [Staphylococcus equorum]